MKNAERILSAAGWIECEAGWRHSDTEEEVYTEREALEEEAKMDSILGSLANLTLLANDFCVKQ